jgi:biotin carboxyl carrier protein
MKILLESVETPPPGGTPTESRPDREFELRPEGDGFRLTVGGVEQSVTGPVGAVTRALVDGRPVEASVRREGELIVVEYHGRRYEYRVRDARAPKIARRRHEETAAGELHAPMPGLVVEIFAAIGDRVEAGNPLVVVEAMKMQNALPAPLSGRVTALSVSPGTPVESGALLLTVTPDET